MQSHVKTTVPAGTQSEGEGYPLSPLNVDTVGGHCWYLYGGSNRVLHATHYLDKDAQVVRKVVTVTGHKYGYGRRSSLLPTTTYELDKKVLY